MDKKLEIKGLCVSFATPEGEVHALRGIDLSLYSGETLAIVGESGSGKSVTSKAILGILPPNAMVKGGEIIYEGRDLLKNQERDFYGIRGNKIAMIFQDPMSSLDPIVKVGRQISEAVRVGRKKRIRRSEARKIALKLMRDVGIPDAVRRFNQYPFEFSGGMRQRIVIAIALAADADVLICDEPTTALDVTIQAQILELINRLKEERGLSVIFITHDLGVVANMADRIAVVYAGKIVEYGTTEEIFYDARHPYTWALLSSMPDLDSSQRLEAIAGAPPSLLSLPRMDAFAPRNKYALNIDFEAEPPFFKISETHSAATWLLHPHAPKVEPPEKIKRMREWGRDG